MSKRTTQLAFLIAAATSGCIAGDGSGTSTSESNRLSVRDVAAPLTDNLAQFPFAGVGTFDAAVDNQSSRVAEVTLQFFMVETLVHETVFREVQAGAFARVAGPEAASLLIASAFDDSGALIAQQAFVFGIDVQENELAVFILQDPPTPTPPPDDTDTNGQPDVDTGGVDDVTTDGEQPQPTPTPRPRPRPTPRPTPDCNGNGDDDAQEIAAGSASDCNQNGFPDECDLAPCLDPAANARGDIDCGQSYCTESCQASGWCPQQCSADCQFDGVPDECELVENDCDSNGVPDECDADCDGNETPDACETFEDCNSTGIPDECEIAAGTAADLNSDGTPDECETCTNGIDGNIVVMIDCSGSMSAADIEEEVRIARTLLDEFAAMAPSPRVAIGTFHGPCTAEGQPGCPTPDHARLIAGLTDEINALYDALDGVVAGPPSGLSDLAQAITLAQAALPQFGGDQAAANHIIVITDGVPTYPDEGCEGFCDCPTADNAAEDAALGIKESGTSIFTFHHAGTGFDCADFGEPEAGKIFLRERISSGVEYSYEGIQGAPLLVESLSEAPACDDDDPCTRDRCTDGICTHEPIEGCDDSRP